MNHRHFPLCFAVAASVLLSCAGIAAASDTADQDVTEAAFRELFGSPNGPGLVACLQVPDGGANDWGDPTDDFLARFADLKSASIVAASRCGKATKFVGTIEKDTGDTAMIYSVGPVKCQSATVCEVEAAYYGSPTAAAGYQMHLKKKHGRWTVVRKELLWIS